MIFTLLLAAILSTTSPIQGDVINLTVEEPYHVVLDDCMYFEDTLTKEANLSRGSYAIRVTHSCEGVRQIQFYSNNTLVNIMDINVKEVEDPASDLQKLDKEILDLKKSLKKAEGRIEYLESLVNTLNSINVELYDRLKEYRDTVNRLQNELNEAKKGKEYYIQLVNNLNESLKALEANLTAIKNENNNMKEKITEIEESLEASKTYLSIFQSLFFLTLAFLVGTYFSIFRK
jgi:uncharacterized phage infection (PIP) family protein YhgE